MQIGELSEARQQTRSKVLNTLEQEFRRAGVDVAITRMAKWCCRIGSFRHRPL